MYTIFEKWVLEYISNLTLSELASFDLPIQSYSFLSYQVR